MNLFLVLPYYVRWHYSTAFIDIKNLATNFISFIYTFFSIPLLLRSLFSPWRRFSDSYGKQESIFETLIFNVIMRFVGVFVRLLFIVMGVALLVIVICLSVLVFLTWLLLPFVIIYAFLFGVRGIII